MLSPMGTLLLAIAAGLGFIFAYHTYGRWLGHRIFALSAKAVCPSHRLCDNADYVPTKKAIVFGHHFTSIAGTGPIVGPAIAVMWGWLPALIWVVLGSVFIGAVHDLGALVVSLRHNGQTIGDVAGQVLNKRVRLLFLLILFLGLTIVLAIFGLVIATVFRQYPASIFPCTVQIPIAVAIGVWLHKRGANLLWPSLIALAVMYLTVVIGDENFSTDWPVLTPLMRGLHAANAWMASWSNMAWVIALLIYSYVASVLPVWLLLQPRDYINSLQLLSAMGLIVVGLVVAAAIGGAPPVEGAARQPLEIVAPMWNPNPAGAPMIFPFLFITVACGAVSGFHCLVSSGTSSKQIDNEPDARLVGYGSMLTEAFLATLVIIACVAGLGLGIQHTQYDVSSNLGVLITTDMVLFGQDAFDARYESWSGAGGLASTVGAFVDGAANLLRAAGTPVGVAVALMGVLVASFAGTTMDTACRLQRYVVQELAATFLPRRDVSACPKCGYTLWQRSGASVDRAGASSWSDSQDAHSSAPDVRASVATGGASREAASGEVRCPECGEVVTPEQIERAGESMLPAAFSAINPAYWLTNKHGATIFAIIIAAALAALPVSDVAPGFWSTFLSGGIGEAWTWLTTNGGRGGIILWPLFGATNQLLAGLSFIVITLYLWRRRKPLWFLIVPMIFMLIMPLWAMGWQVFVGSADSPRWLMPSVGATNWTLALIGIASIAIEIWMIVEALLVWPRVRGVMEAGATDAGLGRARGGNAPHDSQSLIVGV